MIEDAEKEPDSESIRETARRIGERIRADSLDGLGSPVRRASCSPSAVPTDRVRLHVSMWNMARALGLGWTSVDATRPDHELLEEIGAAVTPALARAFREGNEYGDGVGFARASNHAHCYAPNPYDKSIL